MTGYLVPFLIGLASAASLFCSSCLPKATRHPNADLLDEAGVCQCMCANYLTHPVTEPTHCPKCGCTVDPDLFRKD